MQGLPAHELLRQLQQMIGDVFQARDITVVREEPITLRLRGQLLTDSDKAYATVSSKFEPLGWIAMFRREEDDDVVHVVQGTNPEATQRPWIAIILLLATVLSVLYTGMGFGAEMGASVNLLDGCPFALGLLGILLAHELGHYIVGTRLGVPVSLPYFIPMPLTIFGTMGAFIRMKGPAANRRRMLLMAAAGPLAGLAVAIPVLLIGLSLSDVRPEMVNIPAEMVVFKEGNSLLYLVAKLMVFGQLLPANGYDVWLHPLAFAGWAGLFVTGLNLLPAGQLDGGHILYAWLGKRSRTATWVVVGLLVVLDAINFFLYRQVSWSLLVVLILLLGRTHATPLDDITELELAHKVLAAVMMATFVLVFVPIPMVILG
jgi:membrane-associated protease RseP (regulator of RpoE activity)